MLRLLLPMLLLLFLPGGSTAAQTIDAVSITVAGTFKARSEAVEQRPGTPNGVSTKGDIELVQKSHLVCARLGLGLGVEYIPEGNPKGASTDMTFVTRIPAPGMVDPKGRRYDKSEYTLAVRIGEPRYRLYVFDEAWEIVPGEWVFEFLHAGRKVGETRFVVMQQCGMS